MPRFTYVALDARGQESTGLVEAHSSNEAIGRLRQAGYFPTSVYEEGRASGPDGKVARATAKAIRAAKPRQRKNIVLFQRQKIKPKTLMIFTRQLATLIDAGLPLLRGLNVLAKQERDAVLKRTIDKLAEGVQGGGTFSETLGRHPLIFNNLYVNMVKAGEVGGVLELVLGRLAEFQEKAQKIKNKVVAAMVYPISDGLSAHRHDDGGRDHGISARLYRAEIRSDLSRHARRQTAADDHPLRHRREQLREKPRLYSARLDHCRGRSLQIDRPHAPGKIGH
ncbi:MAG: hypothetical protein DMF25_03315 [Verrucomicrobia bacterium]|nr:MAG: hypothetical protein DMF25_03315 [Verrucomicrobiota bacterium]